jgi:hypothetical protein
MARLLVHVEGETEETFVNEILAPHLIQRGFAQVSARLMGNARQRDRRGGIRSWSSVRKDIVNHLRGDVECLVTTMVDYYALPQSGAKAWPGRYEASHLSFAQKALTVQAAMTQDIEREMGDSYDPARFIPYVIMHEFEGLLFSDCDRFSAGVGRPDLASQLRAIRSQFATPEEINDSPQTCPSNRIAALVPDYEKPLMGVLAILEIGLPAIRRECAFFHQWLERLEAWSETTSRTSRR